MNLERSKEILSNWEEIDYRLFIKAVNKRHLRPEYAYVKPVIETESGDSDIYLQLSICLNDENSSEFELVQASAPWEYLKYLSGKSVNDIWGIALENTLNMFPPVCTDLRNGFIEDLISAGGNIQNMAPSYFMNPGVQVDKPETCLVVTNAGNINGATVLFLPGVKEKLSDICGGDLIIAFTSAHEAMVHPYEGRICPEDIEQILSCDVFKNEPDHLSSKIYIYEKEVGVLREYISTYDELMIFDRHTHFNSTNRFCN